MVSWLFCSFSFEQNHSESKEHIVDQCSIANESFSANEYLVYRVYYNWGPIWIPAGEASFELTEEEEDMLDLAFGLTHTSRLGCQIILSKELDGMRIKIPSSTRNIAF